MKVDSEQSTKLESASLTESPKNAPLRNLLIQLRSGARADTDMQALTEWMLVLLRLDNPDSENLSLITECLSLMRINDDQRHEVFESAQKLASSENPFVSLSGCRAMLSIAERDQCYSGRASHVLSKIALRAAPPLAKRVLSMNTAVD